MLSWPNLKCHVDWKVVIRIFPDQYQVIFGLEQMIEDDVMT
jgi:hypothetical protein